MLLEITETIEKPCQIKYQLDTNHLLGCIRVLHYKVFRGKKNYNKKNHIIEKPIQSSFH